MLNGISCTAEADTKAPTAQPCLEQDIRPAHIPKGSHRTPAPREVRRKECVYVCLCVRNSLCVLLEKERIGGREGGKVGRREGRKSAALQKCC